MSRPRPMAIRWTMGQVSPQGFEALRLSIWGAWKIFGPEAQYAVCVNSLPPAEARRRSEPLPAGIRWEAATREDMPAFLRPHLDRAMAEGVGWKFVPLHLFPQCYELALDNDCILWEMPSAIRNWLEDTPAQRCVLAEDVRACFGQFTPFCGSAPRNSGIRGLPPGYDLEYALQRALRANPVLLASELDEQGLQVAAISHECPPWVVTLDEVSVCSPFPPHRPHLGTCGAHFVGLNAHELPWSLENRPAVDYIRDHWLRHRTALYEKVGLADLGD